MRWLAAVGGALLVVVLMGSSSLGAPPNRNCDIATPLGIGTGENAPYGYVADQIEVTFCGNRRLSPEELTRFTATYGLTLAQIVSPRDQSLNAYYFRIITGATPPDVVRRVANDADVRSVSVVPLGRATAPSNLPSTSTTGERFSQRRASAP